MKWSKESTILLISAWLNTSKDAVVGNDQTSSRFWERISEYYNTNKKYGPTRSGKQCKDHWNKINQKVARFNGCYTRVQQARHSGWSDEQILENAHLMYKSENKNSNFQHVDCWRLLKEEPKWNATHQAHHTKRAKVSESGRYTSSSNADLSDREVREVRPCGQKAAKKKEKEKRRNA